MGIMLRGYILSIFILSPFSLFAQPTKSSIEKIAVLPFSVNVKVTVTDYKKGYSREININDELKEFITSQLITQLTKSQLFTVVERSRIELVMEEQKLSLTGVIDENSAVELGQLLAADKLLYGVIENVGTLYSEVPVTVSVKLVDALTVTFQEEGLLVLSMMSPTSIEYLPLTIFPLDHESCTSLITIFLLTILWVERKD